ncbi:MAG: hypothetical protein PHD73_13515 [Sediminibacterium sp.]|nr:hypothetical protein [Sediminibacterium sp.]
MKQFKFFLFLLSLTAASNGFGQFANPMLSGLDTLYMPADSMISTVDPDPSNNPFLSSGQVRTQDDPGGPGSGGGGATSDPPPDAIIPLDGGVAFLIIAGALLGFKRRKES